MKIAIQDISLKLMLNILKKLHDLHNYLPFSPERIKIKKIEKYAANLHDKKNVTHIQNIKKTLNYGLEMKNVPRVFKKLG